MPQLKQPWLLQALLRSLAPYFYNITFFYVSLSDLLISSDGSLNCAIVARMPQRDLQVYTKFAPPLTCRGKGFHPPQSLSEEIQSVH